MSLPWALQDVVEQRQREPRMGMALRGHMALPIDLEVLAEALMVIVLPLFLAPRSFAREPISMVSIFFLSSLPVLPGCSRYSPVCRPVPRGRQQRPGGYGGSRRAVFLFDDCSGKGKAGRYPAVAAVGLRQMFVEFKGGLDLGHGVRHRLPGMICLKESRSERIPRSFMQGLASD